MAKKSAKQFTNFFFELGMHKKIEHCGTKFAGVKHPDTLGEHSARAAQIGFALALEENGNAEKITVMCLMHDIGEIRIGDAHRIAQRYLNHFIFYHFIRPLFPPISAYRNRPTTIIS